MKLLPSSSCKHSHVCLKTSQFKSTKVYIGQNIWEYNNVNNPWINVKRLSISTWTQAVPDLRLKQSNTTSAKKKIVFLCCIFVLETSAAPMQPEHCCLSYNQICVPTVKKEIKSLNNAHLSSANHLNCLSNSCFIIYTLHSDALWN